MTSIAVDEAEDVSASSGKQKVLVSCQLQWILTSCSVCVCRGREGGREGSREARGKDERDGRSVSILIQSMFAISLIGMVRCLAGVSG